MNIRNLIIFTALLLISPLLVFAQSEETDAEKDKMAKLRWLKEHVEGLNTQAEYVNFGLDYDEDGNITYVYAQNPYGNQETTERTYTFNLKDIDEVVLQEEGILITTKGEENLISMKEVSRYSDVPKEKEEELSELRMLSDTQPQRLQTVIEALVRAYN